ncbi:MAG: Rrf2 family transcriptional regulator [bacterium]
MFQVTSGSAYAIRGVVYLALRSPQGALLVSEIAQAHEIPERYLAKIFQGLARHGVLRSTRGIGGGFSLARAPSRITLMDIVKSCEGPILVSKCLAHKADCDKKDICGLCVVWEKLQKQVVSLLEKTTIQDVLDILAKQKEQDILDILAKQKEMPR